MKTVSELTLSGNAIYLLYHGEGSSISVLQLPWAEDSVTHGCCRTCLPKSEQSGGCNQVHCCRF